MAHALPLGAGTVDRLLSGRMEPDDAPPGFAGVAELVRVLTAPPTAAELAGQAAAVAAASALMMAPPSPLERVGRERAAVSRGWAGARFRRAKVLSLVVAATLLGSTGLAAAGVLPDPVQDVAHRILSKVGIHVPASSDNQPADTGGQVAPPVGSGAEHEGRAPGQAEGQGHAGEGVGPPEGVGHGHGHAYGNGNGVGQGQGQGQGHANGNAGGNGKGNAGGNGKGPP